MLFRPEEIIAASSAATKNGYLRRRDFDQFPALAHEANAVRAVGTGIINRHSLIGVTAADQQHEIHRSGHVEDFAIAQGDGVKVEAQPACETFVIGRKCVIAVGA